MSCVLIHFVIFESWYLNRDILLHPDQYNVSSLIIYVVIIITCFSSFYSQFINIYIEFLKNLRRGFTDNYKQDGVELHRQSTPKNLKFFDVRKWHRSGCQNFLHKNFLTNIYECNIPCTFFYIVHVLFKSYVSHHSTFRQWSTENQLPLLFVTI